MPNSHYHKSNIKAYQKNGRTSFFWVLFSFFFGLAKKDNKQIHLKMKLSLQTQRVQSNSQSPILSTTKATSRLIRKTAEHRFSGSFFRSFLDKQKRINQIKKPKIVEE